MPNPSTQLLIRFPYNLGEWLREQSVEEERSMTAIVVDALEAYRTTYASGKEAGTGSLKELLAAVAADPDPRWAALVDLLRQSTIKWIRTPPSDGKRRDDAHPDLREDTLTVVDPRAEIYASKRDRKQA